MLRKSLLAGVCVTAATILYTVPASAFDATILNNDGVPGNSIEAPLLTASEIPASALFAARDVEFNVLPNQPGNANQFPAGQSFLRVTLEGATFPVGVIASAITTGPGGSCGGTLTATVSDGGSSGQSTVLFTLSNANACTDLDGIRVKLPLQVVGNTAVKLTVKYTTDFAGNNNVEAVNTAPIQFITPAPALTTTFTPATLPSNPILALIANNYNTLNSPVIGAITNVVSSGPQTTVGIDWLTVDPADITNAVTSLPTGSLIGLDTAGVPSQLGANNMPLTPAVTGRPTVTLAGALGSFTAQNVSLLVDANNATLLVDSDYEGTVVTTFNALTGIPVQTRTGIVGKVRREGTNFTIPWVADDSANNAIVRLVARAPLGPVRVTRLGRVAGFGSVAPAPVTVPLPGAAGGMSAGQEIIIDRDTFISLFNADFAGATGRADILFTIEGAAANVQVDYLNLVPGVGLVGLPLKQPSAGLE